MPVSEETLSKLLEPIAPGMLQFRAGVVNPAGTRAMALAYIDARTVQDRLDTVVGPANWKTSFHWATVGNATYCVCTLSIHIDRGDLGAEWIGKCDGAGMTNFDPVKGGMSDALKRAAVHWGIGRALYFLDPKQSWVACLKKGKNSYLQHAPALPQWYMDGHLCDPEKLNAAPSVQEPPPVHAGADVNPPMAAATAPPIPAHQGPEPSTQEIQQAFAPPQGSENFQQATAQSLGQVPAPPPARVVPAGFPPGINPDNPIAFGKKVMKSGRVIKEYTWGEIAVLEPGSEARSYVEWMAKACDEKVAQGKNPFPAMLLAKQMKHFWMSQEAAQSQAGIEAMDNPFTPGG